MSKEKKVEKKAVKAKAPAKATGNSVTKFVRAKLNSGTTNVETILEGIRKEFPKAKATPGYIRHIARHIVGKPLPAGAGRKAEKKAEKKASAKGEKKASAKADKKASAKPAAKPEGDAAQAVV